MIVPILWSRSFTLIQNSRHSSLRLIKIYLLFLDEEEKQLKNFYPEIYPISEEEISFNYPSFLKDFDYDTMYLMIKFWIKTNVILNDNIINTISCKISQNLFKMFLRHHSQINLINIKSFENNPDLPFIINPSNSFSTLQNFQFSADLQQPLYSFPNTYSLLKSLSRSCNSLSNLLINVNFNKIDDKEEIFLNLLNLQKNLKKLTINPHGHIPKPILNSIINQSTLVLIHFKETKFQNSFPFEILLNCKNLKFLIILNCHEYYNHNHNITPNLEIQSYSILLKDIKCKIDTLYINDNNFLSLTISNLIRLSGIHLTTLWLDRTKFSSYIITSEPLSVHCPNLTHLIITLDSTSLFQFNNSLSILISNLNLQYFGIRSFGWTNELISDLGNYLPPSLKYLELSSFFDFEALYMLLKNCKCQLRGLSMIFFNEDHLKFIVDYAKINKGFRLLGIDIFLSEESEEILDALKTLKEETNIKIVDQDEVKLKSSPLYFDYIY